MQAIWCVIIDIQDNDDEFCMILVAFAVVVPGNHRQRVRLNRLIINTLSFSRFAGAAICNWHQSWLRINCEPTKATKYCNVFTGETLNALRTDGEFCHRATHRNCPKYLRLSEHTVMIIHWKALEENFLMATLVFRVFDSTIFGWRAYSGFLHLWVGKIQGLFKASFK
jgi:hypothetical protein